MEVESTGEARSWPRRKEGRLLGTTTLHFPPRRIGCPDRHSARHRRSWLRPGSPLVPNLPAVFVLLLPAFGRSKGFDIFSNARSNLSSLVSLFLKMKRIGMNRDS
jgi:hypothetical protein